MTIKKSLDYDGILADLKQGLSNAEIAARRNCSHASISIFAVANGFTGRTIRLNHEGIIADLRAGYTRREIAQRRGGSVDAISDIAKANGLSRPTRRIPQGVRDAVIADVRAGLTHEKTGLKYGLSRRYVGELAEKAGLGKSLRERLPLYMEPVGASGFSTDTEILTRARGWAPAESLTFFDEVAARTAGGDFTWQNPGAVTVARYQGEMIRFHGRSLDLMVAPGQPMRWTRYGGKKATERAGRADRLEGMGGACLVATSTWDAPDLGHKVFTSLDEARHGPASRKVFMTGDQYAAFMGMYLAEGCAVVTPREWRVLISQTLQGKGYEEYRALLVKILGREPGRSSGSWSFCSRALVQNLLPLGKTAKSKQIPADILDMSRRQLEIFWRYYWLGDGSMAGPMQVVATASRLMAGQLQEVIQKRGFSASASEQRTAPTSLVASSGTIYKLGVRTTRYPEYEISRVPYDGLIADVQVPSGSIYVRRNGRAVWAGA